MIAGIKKVRTDIIAADVDKYINKEIIKIYWKDGTSSTNCKSYIKEAFMFGKSELILEEGLWKEFLQNALYVVFKEAI